MKMVIELDAREFYFSGDPNEGACLSCDETVSTIDPDVAMGTCPFCGVNAVYGWMELARRGTIEVVDDSNESAYYNDEPLFV
jgi:hypothetical protein